VPAAVTNVVLPFDGDFEALRRTLAAWGFTVGERPNAPLFAQGPGVTLHAYRTGKVLLSGPRAEEWARELRREVAPAKPAATAPPAPKPTAVDERAGWVMHFDGLCEPSNPGGVAAYGYQVLRDGRVVHEGSGLAAPPGPGATNNVAEFRALVEGLRWLQAQGARGVLVRGDSRLVVETVSGRWKLNAAHLIPMRDEARALLLALEGRLEWVPREENKEADRLSRVGFRDAVRAHPEWGLRA
jgi:ribonuclease HI